jgi:hypothetical protein
MNEKKIPQQMWSLCNTWHFLKPRNTVRACSFHTLFKCLLNPFCAHYQNHLKEFISVLFHDFFSLEYDI